MPASEQQTRGHGGPLHYSRGRLWVCAAWLAALVIPQAVGQQPVNSQVLPPGDELILPTTIAESDIEMSGRYARQWKDEDGTLIVLFQGDFRLDAGRRKLAAQDAVVWIDSKVDPQENRRHWDLTVYLWGNAEVQDAAGTVTIDDRLLVTNLQTFGRIIKHHDAHAPETAEQSALYEEALRDRALIEAGGEAGQTMPGRELDVSRPLSEQELRLPKPSRVITYRLPATEPTVTPSGETVQVARGRVYFAQSGGGGPLVEIQADNAVVFPTESGAELMLPGEGIGGEAGGAAEPGAGGQPQPGQQPPAEPGAAPADQPQERPADARQRISQQIRGVYLEGDVVLSAGSRFIRADRLYYDFENERALILDAVFRADIPQRDIPLYVRADEVRQLSATEYRADNAKITTSEFYSPHYHVGADRVYVRDLTPGGIGAGEARLSGEYELRNATLNVEGLPVAWWPYSRGRLDESETSLRSFRMAYSDDFGATVESRWYLFNLLGVAAPPGFDATLKLDGYSERGPGVGIDLDYERPDYYGLVRTYGIYDNGEDNLGPFRNNEPERKERGRFLWRHRHYLPEDWQLTMETSYISDPNFLEEYFESEFDEGKEQETLLYLKRARETEAITLLANWRLLDFVTQTEHLPDLAYRRIGDTWLDPVVLYHESRIGMVRYRPDDRRFFDEHRADNTSLTDNTFRTDVREEAELPLKFGWLNLVPYAMLRGSFWDGTPQRDGALWRGMGSYGVRGGSTFSRVFEDVESQLLDIDGIRHIVRPEFAAWWSHSNARSTLITPFDEGIETIDDFHGALLALKQTFQSRRGAGDLRRTVDLLELNLEAGFFGGRVQENEISNGYVNTIRPEDSRTRNYLAGEAIYRLSDTTSVLYDFNFDLNDGNFDRHNLSVAVERLPRLAYVFGVRHAGDIDMNLLGGGFNYKLTEKHIVASRVWFDIDTGRAGEVAVTYIKKLPRWYFGLNMEYDQVDDDFSVSVSLWPEGIPEWTLGSRRFTGVATSTGIRP